MVDTHRLELGRIEERVSREQEHDRRRPISERTDLSCKPVDTAERIARTATGLEIALEVCHHCQADAGGIFLGLAWGTAQA